MALPFQATLPPMVRAWFRSRRHLALLATLLVGLGGTTLLMLQPKTVRKAMMMTRTTDILLDASDDARPIMRHSLSPPEEHAMPTRLVRKGSLQLEVTDFLALEREAQVIASAHGALSQWQVKEDDQQRSRVSFTLKVRPERYDQAVAALKRLGRVVQESSSTEDITRAYADLEARQANKRVAARRLRELIETRAGKLSEVIEAEEALARVTEQLEQMAAEQRVMDHELAFSTLQVEAGRKLAPPAAPSLWTPLSEAMGTARSRLVGGLGDLIVLVATLLPWLGLPALSLAAWFTFRSRRHRATPA